jgi:hypothetical protein
VEILYIHEQFASGGKFAFVLVAPPTNHEQDQLGSWSAILVDQLVAPPTNQEQDQLGSWSAIMVYQLVAPPTNQEQDQLGSWSAILVDQLMLSFFSLHTYIIENMFCYPT